MKSKLFPTQEIDSWKQATSEDLPNFSEPGTGKTITTLAAFEKARLETGLVVCPVIAAPMWQENIERELGAKATILRTGVTSPDRGSDFHIVTYGLVAKHFDDLIQFQPDALILDESQYLKSIEAERTRAVFGPSGDGTGGLYMVCRQCWQLSGTPIERYADDLWTQLRATQPDALIAYNALSLKEFQDMFCLMMWKEYGNQGKYVSVGNQNSKLLNRMLYEEIGIIRRTMDEVEKNMPPVTTREVFVRAKVNAELRALLKGLDEHEIIELLLEGGDKINRAYRLTGMAKLKDTVDYIKSIARHRPVLVGFWHTDVGKELYLQLSKDKFTTNYIDGGTSMEARERIRVRFNEGYVDVLVGQIAAMGVSMNLQTHGAYVIFAEDYWAPSKIEQFWKRVWRLGQTQHVQVDFCRSDIPVDTAIRTVRQVKQLGSQIALASPK